MARGDGKITMMLGLYDGPFGGMDIRRAIDLEAEMLRGPPQDPTLAKVGLLMPARGKTGFDTMVDMMKAREERAKFIRRVALQLADQVINHLNDRDGWHGEDRQEQAKGDARRG